MPVETVKINDRGSTGFVLAAGQARAIADEGGCAKIHYTNDPKATQAAYVWKRGDEYVIETATLIEPDWLNRLRHAVVI